MHAYSKLYRVSCTVCNEQLVILQRTAATAQVLQHGAKPLNVII
jgi:hypothetical protein